MGHPILGGWKVFLVSADTELWAIGSQHTLSWNGDSFGTRGVDTRGVGSGEKSRVP